MLFLLFACQSDSDLTHVTSAPEVALVNPGEGDVLRMGEGPYAADAQVSDRFTPALSLQLTWSLDGVDVAGAADEAGAASWAMPLDETTLGEHEVSLRVTDEDSDTASATAHFLLLGPREAPVVQITLPLDGTTSEPVALTTFQGIATDSVTAPGDLLLAWDIDGSEPEGPITAGGESILLAPLAVGTHVITLSATDTDGDVGSDVVTVTVTDVPIVAEPGDLVFSEMMVDPEVVADEVGEWVELYNDSGSTIDIAGYSFHDDDVDLYVLEGSIPVLAGDYVVLCANLDPATNGGVPCDAFFERQPNGDGLALANGEDELVLSRADGVQIDWLHYDETWYLSGAAIGIDPAFQDAGDNDELSHWCGQTTVVSTGGEPGTPGQTNDVCW
ncbi:MAG: lamin tail domain-containing protein [Myxococcales bacterium]|nr:lamin tail domain-containing protein [Myxococcales bacterium]